MLEKIHEELGLMANAKNATIKQKYFKVVAADDVFIGVSNPEVQIVIKRHEKKLSLSEISTLLKNPIHEYRYGALIWLERRYGRCKNIFEQKSIVDFYLSHTHYINNWDLVDCSCYKILGHYAYTYKESEILEKLLISSNMWEQRMAMVSCMFYIKNGSFELAMRFAQTLLSHKHDLIHKAVGWMLRETWSRGGAGQVEEFIRDMYPHIHRTTLRYAIEKMPEIQRKSFLIKR
jgi:3-methyladenine DNA glycosylase AlkD